MSYEAALNKAWQELEAITKEKRFSVRFLADEYAIDLNAHKVLSLACNAVAKDYITILLLHYLVKKLKGLPKPEGNWISFKELPGGLGYYDAFRKRSLEPIIHKYGGNPTGLLSCLERLPAKKVQYGDCGIVVEAFIGIPVVITVFGQDQEFSAEANMLFDRTINQIFSTEDIAVFAGLLANAL